jgi:hypothetical protein
MNVDRLAMLEVNGRMCHFVCEYVDLAGAQAKETRADLNGPCVLQIASDC